MEVSLTHIGGPTVLVQIGDWRLLTDPTFDPAGGSYRFGWGTGSQKLTGPAIAAADLKSHRRGPAESRPPRRQPGPRRASDAAVSGQRDHHGPGRETPRGTHARGLAPVGNDAGSRRRVAPPIEITATPCRRGPPLSRPIVGDVIGFALSWDGPGARRPVDLRATRCSTTGCDEVADRLHVGTALLHLGGVRFPISRSAPLHDDRPRRQSSCDGLARAPHGHPDPLRGVEALPGRP